MSLNSLQNSMDRRAAEMAQMAQHAKNPQEIQAIQQHLIAGVQNGSIKPYIGVPLIQELTQKLTAAKASTAMGAMGPQAQGAGAPVAQEILQQAEQEQSGVGGLPSNLPQEYAGGGIIAFADGGMSDEDDDETSVDFNTKDDDAEDAQIMAMFAPKRRTAGLESLMAIPAGRYEAEKVSPSGDKYEAISVEKGQSGGVDDRLLKHILHKESRGQRYDKEGNLLTSSKGAMGEMQVMPGTSRDPGFGITPARGNSPDELRRVGDEYARAMLSRYQDPKLAAIAYNWGPGNTDKWLSAGADMSKLPKETRGYIQGLAKGGAVRFQNRGIVDLGEDDFTTIPDMYQGNTYESALRRAKGIPDEETKPRYTPGQMLPGFTDRMMTPEPMGIEGLQPSTLYADAIRAAKGNPPAADTTPSRSLKDVLLQDAAAKEASKQALIDKVANSDYAKQMGNVAGFFGDMGSNALSGLGTLGKHLVSAPGYGFSSEGPARAAADKAVDTATQAVTAPDTSAQDKKAVFRGQINKSEKDMQDRAAAQEAQAARDAAQAAAANQTQAAPTAPQADSVSELTNILKQQRGDIKKQKEIDNYMALLSAGLGMYGGTSPFASANIGAGAQQGINYMLQAGKSRAADERNLLSGHLGLEKAKMYAAAQQAGLDERTMNHLTTNLGLFEKNARTQAISLIGQDKLGAMEPAAQQAAVDRMAAKILSESKPYQSQMKRLLGEDYTAPSAAQATGSNWTYDPTKRKLSAS